MHPKPTEILRGKVESSNIASIGYDSKTKTLVVEFKNHTIYAYHPVTHAGFEALRTAESVGKYFFAHFRNNDKLAYVKLP
jgi:KTSC domain